MRTPNVTLAQLSAVTLWVASQAVAFGWVSSQREQVLLSAGSTVLAVAWKIADALIRNGRTKLAIEHAAEAFQLAFHAAEAERKAQAAPVVVPAPEPPAAA